MTENRAPCVLTTSVKRAFLARLVRESYLLDDIDLAQFVRAHALIAATAVQSRPLARELASALGIDLGQLADRARAELAELDAAEAAP